MEISNETDSEKEHIPHLHLLSTCKDTLHRPSSELCTVVFHLRSNNRSFLSVEVLPPVQSFPCTTLGSRVKLVERFYRDKRVSFAQIRVDFCPHNQVHSLFLADGQIELPVPVQTRCEGFRFLLRRVKGVLIRSNGFRGSFNHLRGKVLVDVGGFEGERSR